jgi:hypothetical protein
MLSIHFSIPRSQQLPRRLELGVPETDACLLHDRPRKLALGADSIHMNALIWGHVVDVSNLQAVRPFRIRPPRCPSDNSGGTEDHLPAGGIEDENVSLRDVVRRVGGVNSA